MRKKKFAKKRKMEAFNDAPSSSHVDTTEYGGVGDQMDGYIFMCSTKTKPDCFIYRVFGLPASRADIVEKIKPNTNLFLFDFELRLLYGQYVADSSGMLAIEPYAFGGRFPAQVKFSIVRDCLPLPEVAFKDAIKENYSGSKFRQHLSAEQVIKLVSLFRPITIPVPPRTSPLSYNVTERFHPGCNGSSGQIAKLPAHGQTVAGFGLSDVQLYPRVSNVQEVRWRPLHLAHNQVAFARNQNLASQSFLSQPSYQQFDSAHSHQAYHPEDPGLHQHSTHPRNAYLHLKSSSTVVSQVLSTNTYYGLNPTPQSNVPLQQSQVVTHKSTIPSSSLTASQWVAVASNSQTPGIQGSSFTVPPRTERNASYDSNFKVAAYGYQNLVYPSSNHEQSVDTVHTHAFQQNPTSLSTYYAQNQGNPVLPRTLSSGSSEVPADEAYTYSSSSTASASGYQYQGYQSYHQTPSVVGDQSFGCVPAHSSEAHLTYWNAAPSGHISEQYPISQVTVPVGSAVFNAGYVPAYYYGANPTA